MDNYTIISKYYDKAYSAKANLVDLPFYVDLAKEIGGPMLELGCGTGRVLIPTAREGIKITGLDISESMLSILKDKLAKEDSGTRSRVECVQGDIKSFRSTERYSLVTIPFRAFQHMYTVEEQVKALTTARECLSDEGILAFDVFNPRMEKIFAGIGEEYLDLEWEEGDYSFKRFFRKEQVDKKHLNFSGSFIFRTYDNGKMIDEETSGIKMSFYTYPHLIALFQIAGLEVLEMFGSFEKDVFCEESREMIFLLRRCGGNR